MAFAFVFPGQGSQSLKMMDELLEYPIIQETFDQAQQILGIDFLAMLQEETSDNINQTVNTQPLLLTAGYAIYKLWLSQMGDLPMVMAGHSLGEWTSLVASGVLNFTDALKLVKIRATAMQEAVLPGSGAMAAVMGLDDEKIISICDEIAQKTHGVVAAVNFNSPAQVVIAGDKISVEAASIALKDNGAKKVQPLAVSVPSHCKLMIPASEKLAEALANVEFKQPQIEVIHNFNVQSYTDTELIKQALVKQLYQPVLWSKTINTIANSGVTHIVECGPGKVLASLNKRINENLISYNLRNPAEFTKAMAELG
ncbi:MAG: ACP S-malonyltransferase [Burkholderiales bacterium]|nr:ACP S-malonyltransferase [Burkholderiales bacterium]